MRPELSIEGNNVLRLKVPYEDRELAKSILGRRWNPRTKAWEYPLNPDIYEQILDAFPYVRVSYEVAEAIAEAKQLRQEVEQAKVAGWQNAAPDELMPIKTEPFRHQILGFNLGLKLPCIALLMEQGVGKTLTAIAIAGRRFQRGEIYRVLIVAPASVVPVWPAEFIQHADFPFEVYALEGPIPHRIERLAGLPANPSRLQVAVTNYEATWRMEEALAAWEPDMIIADESQRIKTPSAQQSKAMHRLGQKAPYRMILTGTPVTQGPLDFFSQYKFLDISIFGYSFTKFRERYAVMGGYEGHQVVGYKNLDELTQKAHSIAFRVTKAEALDLPEQVDQVRYCDLEPSAMKIYRELRDDCMARITAEKQIVASNVLTQLLRLSQVCGGFVTDEAGTPMAVSEAKLQLLDEVLGDLLDAGKKVVIFARFLPEIAAIRQRLGAQRIGYACITGEVAMKDRGEEVKRFQNDAECRVFVAQIQAAGLGITLTAADTAIFYSLDFSYANYDQARARIHRIGQRNACTYIHLLARDTVDEKVMGALRRKKNVADEVVDGWRKFFEEGGE